MTTKLERLVICEYCNDTGEIETDNNWPIGKCPICNGADKRPQNGLWAPGMYSRTCKKCGIDFIGDTHCDEAEDAYAVLLDADELVAWLKTYNTGVTSGGLKENNTYFCSFCGGKISTGE